MKYAGANFLSCKDRIFAQRTYQLRVNVNVSYQDRGMTFTMQ